MNPYIRVIVIGVLAILATILLLGPILALANPAAERYRSHVIRETQLRFGIPSPSPVVAGQIAQESAWNPNAKSPVGAQGLMQFMPATARWADVQAGFGGVDAFNPLWSIRAGVWYDRWLYDRVKGRTTCDRWMFALSAYNGGLGWVNKRKAKSEDALDYVMTAGINPGITKSNQHENESYPTRIMYRHQPVYRHWGRVECLL
jgi:soluble lytic murein transglycosylase-like protein